MNAILSFSLFSAVFKTMEYSILSWTLICNNFTLRGDLDLIAKVLWTRLRASFNVYVSILCVLVSDLPGSDPATLDEMILYYRLTAKWMA